MVHEVIYLTGDIQERYQLMGKRKNEGDLEEDLTESQKTVVNQLGRLIDRYNQAYEQGDEESMQEIKNRTKRYIEDFKDKKIR